MSYLIPLRLKTMRATTRAASFALLTTAFLSTALLVSQEAPSHKPISTAASKPVRHSASSRWSKAASAAPGQASAAAAPAVAPTPAVPPAPVWPINEEPQQARIAWDSHGLQIEATNSSLDQILHQVSAATGVKIEGFGKDQRIFGSYGPGPAREVLSRLLDGTGYNVLMIGGQGDAPPGRILLSTAGPAGSQPSRGAQIAQSTEDTEADEPEPPEQPVQQTPQQPQQAAPIRNPFGDTPRVPVPGMNQPQASMPPDQQSNPQQQ